MHVLATGAGREIEVTGEREITIDGLNETTAQKLAEGIGWILRVSIAIRKNSENSYTLEAA